MSNSSGKTSRPRRRTRGQSSPDGNQRNPQNEGQNQGQRSGQGQGNGPGGQGQGGGGRGRGGQGGGGQGGGGQGGGGQGGGGQGGGGQGGGGNSRKRRSRRPNPGNQPSGNAQPGNEASGNRRDQPGEGSSGGGSRTRVTRKRPDRRAGQGPGQGQGQGQGPRQGGPRQGQGRRKRVGGRGRSAGGGAGSGQSDKLRRMFEELHQTVSIDPYERWNLSRSDGSLTPRVIDLVAPLGKGQRCLIVAPPKAGKTTLLLEICKSLEVNHPEAQVFALLVDERPEEVTHFRRACHAEVIAASSDQTAREHVKTTEAAIERILKPVLEGEDVVLLLDSITRLARAYNTVKGDSGRTLSGGLDANTMQIPRRLFGAARKIEGGGSLTILGTALIDTGSRMDEVIFQEFKGTGNTEIVLSRQLFEKRIFPAVDIAKSGTRKEEKLYDPEFVDQIFKVRRVLSSMTPDRAMEGLLKQMQKHATNEELLVALPGR